MTFKKRLAARLLAGVMAVIMLFACGITAGADNIKDTAVSVATGETAKGTIPADLHKSDFYYDYKIDVVKDGVFKCKFNASCNSVNISLYDSNGNYVLVNDCDVASGHVYGFSNGNVRGADSFTVMSSDLTDRSAGTVSYSVSKGTYYFRIRATRHTSTGFIGNNVHTKGTGKYSFKFTFPGKKVKISYLSLTLSKGDTLNLNAIMNSNGADVTWSSSNKEVASVSKKGKITAKSKGYSNISAKIGNSKKKIRIIVK